MHSLDNEPNISKSRLSDDFANKEDKTKFDITWNNFKQDSKE